jgi:hypothetical protein
MAASIRATREKANCGCSLFVLVLDCKNKRQIRWPFGRLALLLARHSPLRGCSSLAPRQPPKWPADYIAYFCNQALVFLTVNGIMEITLEIPETVAKTLGYAPEALPRRALEALLVDECSRGRLTRGKVDELFGLSFQENEDLFRDRRVPYPIKSQDDDILDNAVLKCHQDRG